jgi:hypothetical protein
MYLLYVDESGIHKGSGGFEHFVMGGLALHEEDVYPFGRAVANLQRRVLPKHPDLEIHATDVFSGRREWAAVPRPDRMKLLNAVFSFLETWEAPSGRRPTYFGVAVHRPAYPNTDLLELAHLELFRRFDIMLSRLHQQGDSHRSLVVADNSSYEKILQKLVPEWKVNGTPKGKLHGLIEVPLFVDSTASRSVQMADSVAWATFNYYERGKRTYLQKLHGGFDSVDGIQHGLAHLNRRPASCSCVPCVSRRTKTVGPTLAHWPLQS